MTEKKREPKNRYSGELERTLTEILVADKRSTEPFIKTFTAVGENVSKLDLGMLVGVFEVDEKSEEAAYIVNFLASVAKKEYFNNPRRGPIESFEAALHKVNVALAELVKHGNIAWLGKLHGALAVLEKNNFHFSVTGQASILLLRQEAVSDISEGLASTEAENHPLKTFVEVSSGRLLPFDTVMLATPELRALFSLENLAKQATRMGEEGFVRFLRTALVNELDMAAVLVVSVSDKTKANAPALRSTPKKPLAETSPVVPEQVSNVFSEQAFKKPAPVLERAASTIEEKNGEEYIDSKTGHIYVQGEIFTEATSRQAFLEKIDHATEGALLFLSQFGSSFRRLTRKGTKSIAFAWWQSTQKSSEVIRSAWRQNKRKFEHWQQERQLAKKTEKEDQLLFTVSESTESVTLTTSVTEEMSIPSPIAPTPTVSEVAPSSQEENRFFIKSSRLQSKLSQFYTPTPATESSLPPLPEDSSPLETLSSPRTVPSSSPALLLLKKRWHKLRRQIRGLRKKLTKKQASLKKTGRIKEMLPSSRKLLLFGLGGIVSILFLAWVFTGEETTPPTATENKSTLPAPSREESAPLTSLKNADAKSFPVNGLRGLVILSNTAYAATPDGILEIESGTFHAAPLPSGKIRFITAMDDLQLIFILTDTNQLLSWSPLSNTYNQNTLPLPENTRVAGIGTYLTYLYVLDTANDQIYRFPRTEGGFGDATNWLRSSVAIDDTALLAVNETISLAPTPESLTAFFQGREAGRFPEAGNIRALSSQPDTTFLYALSADGKRVTLWDLERNFRQNYSFEESHETSYLAANPEANTLYLGDGEENILRFSNIKP